MKRAFVSYSRKNLETVTQLINDLQAVGIESWYDQTLSGGQHWWDCILANIRDCDVFVFSLSPESWDSEACRSELNYVMQLGRPILPVLVADGINVNFLPYPLNEIQVVDYRQRDKGAAFSLIKAINTTPAAKPLPDVLPPPPGVPVSYLSSLKERIDLIGVLNAQEQISLLFELETEVRKGRSLAEVRDLLLRLKRRDDLLAKVATKIDAALLELEGSPLSERQEQPMLDTEKQPERVFNAVEYGKALIVSEHASPVKAAPKFGAQKSRRYACPQPETQVVVANVKAWLDSSGFESQQVETENQGVLLQTKRKGKWRSFVGMGTSLNILFCQSGDLLTVEIGTGKWLDKTTLLAVGTFVVLWPIAVTSGMGIWEQMKMPDKVLDYIGTQLVYR